MHHLEIARLFDARSDLIKRQIDADDARDDYVVDEADSRVAELFEHPQQLAQWVDKQCDQSPDFYDDVFAVLVARMREVVRNKLNAAGQE